MTDAQREADAPARQLSNLFARSHGTSNTPAPVHLVSRIVSLIGEAEPLLAQINLSEDRHSVRSGPFVVVTADLIIVGDVIGMDRHSERDNTKVLLRVVPRRSLRAISVDTSGEVNHAETFTPDGSDRSPWVGGGQVTLEHPDLDEPLALPLLADGLDAESFQELVKSLVKDLAR